MPTARKHRHGARNILLMNHSAPSLRISTHRGRHFRLIVDAVSAGSWTTGVARK
jgi:hypothetical protein